MSETNGRGKPLETGGHEPTTGFSRDGDHRTGPEDRGSHGVCARPMVDFPGLKDGDRWGVCAVRWHEARVAEVAPPGGRECTHALARRDRRLEDLKAHDRRHVTP
jgi:uncharacterized protein (DUF2237 family)